MDEVQMLVDTPCKDDILKRAFLFSILTGLRHSDIQALRWKQIPQTAKALGKLWWFSKRPNAPIISPSRHRLSSYAANGLTMMNAWCSKD